MTDVLVVSEDLDDATKVLALPEVLGGVRLHKALGMHPEKANLGRQPAYDISADRTSCTRRSSTADGVYGSLSRGAEALPQMLALIRSHKQRLACVGEIGQCHCMITILS